MLITPKFPQFEISKTVAPQSSLKQTQFGSNRNNQNTKKGCVPSKFAQNQNESMYDCNSSSSVSSQKINMNLKAMHPKQNQMIQSPQFQRNENSLTIKDLIQAQIQNIDSQNQVKKITGNSDSNQLFNSETMKDKIAAIKLNLGDSNSQSHSLSSSSQSNANFKLIKDQQQLSKHDENLDSDLGQSVSSASLDNVPQGSVPRL